MSTLGRLIPLVLVVMVILLAENLTSGQDVTRVHAPVSSPGPAAAEGKNNYQFVSVSSMVDLLEALSGKHYLRDANLNGVPPISVNTEGLTKDETIHVVTSTLLLNGVAIFPVDDHTMKVITAFTNKNPRNEGLRVYTNASDLPPDDEIVTYYMTLDHIDPQEAAGIFIQVAPPHTYGIYVPSPSAQGIVLTENVSVVRELIELKKSIDVAKKPNVRPPPVAPGALGPQPPGPPHHHPLLCLLGAICGIVLFILAVAAGHVVAHHWLNRGKPSMR